MQENGWVNGKVASQSSYGRIEEESLRMGSLMRLLHRYLLLMVGVVLLYLVGSAFPDTIGFINGLGPLATGAGAVWWAYRLLKTNGLVIWAPWFWFLVGVILFYSLGPLAYVFGRDALVSYLNGSLPIRLWPEDVLRTNLLNGVGIVSILMGIRLGYYLVPKVSVSRLGAGNGVRRLTLLSFWLLGIGGAIQAFVIIPWEFSEQSTVLPGVVYNLAKLYLFGLMILAYLTARGRRRYKILLYPLWGIQLLVAFLHFSKTEVMLGILLPELGFYLAFQSFRRLVYTFIVMAVVYVSIAQLIHLGRDQVVDMGGSLSNASLSQRLSIAEKAIQESEKEAEKRFNNLTSAETGWARLSYANVQSFAMNQYDSRLPGDTLNMVSYVLIPRIVWPDKPITTDVSKYFYKLVVGLRGETHLGLGIFGEGYWNFGWTGVVIVSLVAGLIFWFVGIFSMQWMQKERMEYLPSMFLGVNMGLLGTTQFFANAIVGGGGFFLVYALVVSKAFALVVDGKKRLLE